MQPHPIAEYALKTTLKARLQKWPYDSSRYYNSKADSPSPHQDMQIYPVWYQPISWRLPPAIDTSITQMVPTLSPLPCSQVLLRFLGSHQWKERQSFPCTFFAYSIFQNLLLGGEKMHQIISNRNRHRQKFWYSAP